jgi:hypothetical protein
MTGLDFCVVEDVLVEKAEGRTAVLAQIPQVVAVSMAAERGGDVRCVVRTAWGERSMVLSGKVAPLLRMIDGKVSIAAIGARLRGAGKADIPEAGLIELMVYLRRANVLAFAPPP